MTTQAHISRFPLICTPEIIVFGTGKTVLPPPPQVRAYLNKLGIQIEAHDTVCSLKRHPWPRSELTVSSSEMLARRLTCSSRRSD